MCVLMHLHICDQNMDNPQTLRSLFTSFRSGYGSQLKEIPRSLLLLPYPGKSSAWNKATKCCSGGKWAAVWQMHADEAIDLWFEGYSFSVFSCSVQSSKSLYWLECCWIFLRYIWVLSFVLLEHWKWSTSCFMKASYGVMKASGATDTESGSDNWNEWQIKDNLD